MNTTVSVILLTLVVGVRILYGGVEPNTVAAGIRLEDSTRVLSVLSSEPRLENEDLLFVSWPVALDGSADPALISAVRATGAIPWLRAVFRTPQPVADNLDRLEAELEELASLVRAGGEGLFVQAVWQPTEPVIDIRDRAFVIKRAAVAVTGASSDATFVAGPLEADPEILRALYDHDVAAYLDLIALAPGGELEAAIASLVELDPGKPVVLDALPMPENPEHDAAAAKVIEKLRS